MGSSRWPGARKLYCRSLCFVKPVVNTYWEGKYNYFEKLSKDRIVNTYQTILQIDGSGSLAPLVGQRLFLHVASAGVHLGHQR